MKNIKMLVQYDGSGYSGWQVQPSGDTVQEVIQKAIRRLTGEQVQVVSAGRTDAGVHALGQVASFKTGSGLAPDVIKRALNAVLPDDIRVTDAVPAGDDFHPRYDAASKVYFYIISNAQVVSPFLRRYAWRIPYPLDLGEMRRALSPLRGRHDFSAFRGSGCGAKDPVRTITRLSLRQSDALGFMGARINGPFIRIEIEADGFLRHMVRNIVGTAVEAGRGRIAPETVKDILRSKDRRRAGPTAPARGLFLAKVNYREEPVTVFTTDSD